MSSWSRPSQVGYGALTQPNPILAFLGLDTVLQLSGQPLVVPEPLGQDSYPFLGRGWKFRLLIGPGVLLTLYRTDLSYWVL